jgi:transcriptional regulator of acetoin/glycerol metabolism
MQILEQPLISDHFDHLGLKEGDSFEIQPISGRRKTFVLNRTKIDFISENLKGKVTSQGIKVLGGQKRESFHVQIKRVDCIGRNRVHKHRFLLTVLQGGPVRLNGNYIFNGYIEVKDRLEIGFNRIFFKRISDTDLLDSQEKLIHGNSKVINSSIPILIEGETGVGKTSLAKKIHKASGREGRFVHINISSFSPSLIESEMFGHVKGAFTGAMNDKKGAFREATKGTLFIDEIDSLPLEIQTKLLLFLDDFITRPVGGTIDQKVDLRIIFSSGSKLENLVDKGKMRKDFYFRIASGYCLRLGPLRDNPQLITDLCNKFSDEHCLSFSKKLIEFYTSLLWPGNFRQLKGHLERKVVLSSNNKIDFDYTDEELICQSSELKKLADPDEAYSTLAEIKNHHALKVFLHCDKNYTKASRILGISSRSLRGFILKENLPRRDEFLEY